jgi:hypothetical protein
MNRTKVARACDRVNFALFDDLIHPQQQRRRDGEAEGLGGFHVDDELRSGRLSDRSQSEQSSQDQIDRDKVIQEARHEEDQYAENHGEGRTQVCDPDRHFWPLSQRRAVNENLKVRS